MHNLPLIVFVKWKPLPTLGPGSLPALAQHASTSIYWKCERGACLAARETFRADGLKSWRPGLPVICPGVVLWHLARLLVSGATLCTKGDVKRFIQDFLGWPDEFWKILQHCVAIQQAVKLWRFWRLKKPHYIYFWMRCSVLPASLTMLAK